MCVCVCVCVWLFACIIDNHNNQLTIFPSVSFLSFLKYRFSLLLFFILDTTCRGRSRVHEHVSLSFISVDSCLQFTTQLPVLDLDRHILVYNQYNNLGV